MLLVLLLQSYSEADELDLATASLFDGLDEGVHKSSGHSAEGLL
jgi:hypothetical protein